MRMEIQQRDPSLEEVSVIFLIGVAVINGEAHGFGNLTEAEKRAELHFSFFYRDVKKEQNCQLFCLSMVS